MSDKITDAVYQREPAWHGKGTVVEEDLRTWDEVREHLVIDWDIEQRPVHVGGVRVPNFFAATRTDNDKVLAINSNSYSLIGVEAFGRFVERSMTEQTATWDAFNIIDEGMAMCATIKLDEPMMVPGDPSPVFPYIGFSNRIDAKGSLVADPTAIRQVCWNTNSLFLIAAGDSGWVTSFRHTGGLDMSTASDEVAQTIKLCRQAFLGFGGLARELAEATISVPKFVDRWLPIRQHMSDSTVTRVNHKRDAFNGALTGPRGVERHDSAWGVLQAAVDAYQYSFPVHNGDVGREKRTYSMIKARIGGGLSPEESNRSDDLRRAYSIVLDMAAV